MFAQSKMLLSFWIFLFNAFFFTAVCSFAFERQSDLHTGNFTNLELEESSGEDLGTDDAPFSSFVNHWEETDDDFMNVTEIALRFNGTEQFDSLPTEDWIANEPYFGTTQKYELPILEDDVLSRWLQEEKEEKFEIKSLDFEDYEDEKSESTEEEYKTISFQNNGQILNLTVVTEDIPTERPSPSSSTQFYVSIQNKADGTTCWSLNFTLNVFHQGARLNLLPVNYTISSEEEGLGTPYRSSFSFKSIRAEDFGAKSFFVSGKFGILCQESCFVNKVDFEVKSTTNNEEKFSGTKEKLHLFDVDPGYVYRNSTPVNFEVNKNLTVTLTNVAFGVAKSFRSGQPTLAQGIKFSDYYFETIASVTGFTVLLCFSAYLIYTLRRIKKSKGDFVPPST